MTAALRDYKECMNLMLYKPHNLKRRKSRQEEANRQVKNWFCFSEENLKEESFWNVHFRQQSKGLKDAILPVAIES